MSSASHKHSSTSDKLAVPAATASSKKPRRRRTNAGSGAPEDCFACQSRNTKCDRRRPYCQQCLDMGKECSGYKQALTWGVGIASRGKMRGLSSPAAQRPAPKTDKAPHRTGGGVKKNEVSKSPKLNKDTTSSKQRPAKLLLKQSPPTQDAIATHTSNWRLPVSPSDTTWSHISDLGKAYEINDASPFTLNANLLSPPLISPSNPQYQYQNHHLRNAAYTDTYSDYSSFSLGTSSSIDSDADQDHDFDWPSPPSSASHVSGPDDYMTFQTQHQPWGVVDTVMNSGDHHIQQRGGIIDTDGIPRSVGPYDQMGGPTSWSERALVGEFQVKPTHDHSHLVGVNASQADTTQGWYTSSHETGVIQGLGFTAPLGSPYFDGYVSSFV